MSPLIADAYFFAADETDPAKAFLSYLRLSIYMAIVAIAIVLSFHLKSQPSHLELRMARPLGIIFWLLSLSCLVLGFGNYISSSSLLLLLQNYLSLMKRIETLDKYSKKVAIVQTGWRTQSVSDISYTLFITNFQLTICEDHVAYSIVHRRHLRDSTSDRKGRRK